MREKRTSKVGQSNGLLALCLAFGIPFFTVTAMVPDMPRGEGMFHKVFRVIRSNHPLFIGLGAVILVGGVGLGRLWKGGRVLADAADFGDLDKL